MCLKARLRKAQGKPHNMIAIGNREQHVKSELNVGEAEISNNSKNTKEKLVELAKRGQEMRERIIEYASK